MKNESNVYEKIIEKIRKNRISTTEVADVLGKKGAISGLTPVNRGHTHVGRVFLIYDYDEKNWEIHEQARFVKEDHIVVVEMINCKERAAFGELVAKFMLLYKGAKALVINGYMRDGHRLIKEDYPIWCKGITPIGCLNIKNETPLDEKILRSIKERYEDTIAVCDDGGVVIIPKDEINEEFLKKLEFIELQEDIWSYCVNTKKWTTYDTVALKKYLDTNLLPDDLKSEFEKFVKKG
jgi:4-hydroxy-4-methyl-2-oxoglutarate aldolase